MNEEGATWRIRDHESRLRDIEKTVSALPYLISDLQEIRDDCGKIRIWVEERDKEKERKEAEKERLSKTQWVAIIGAAALILSSMVAAVASLVSAGAL